MTNPATGADTPEVPGTPASVGTSAHGSPIRHTTSRAVRRYSLCFALASAAFTVLWSATSAVLLPNHVQMIEFARWFHGADAGIDLQELYAVRSGTAVGGPNQERLLGLLAEFDAARARSLALVTSVSVACTMVTQPLVGVLSDRTRSRLGRRAPWILFGAVVGSLFLGSLRLASSIAAVTVLWTLTQVFLNTATAPLSTTVADRIPRERRGTVSAVGGLGAFLGGMIGALAAGALFPCLGLDLYLVFAGVIVVSSLGFVLLAKDTSSKGPTVPAQNWRTLLAGFVAPLRARDFRWVWIARVLLTFGYTVSSSLSFFMLQSYVSPGLSHARATAVVPLLAVAGLPFTLAAAIGSGALSDRLGRRKPFVISASLLMAASMAIPLIQPTVPALFGQAILAGLAFGIYLPVDQALFVDVLPDRLNNAGRDLGIAGIATNIGQVLGPVFAAQVVVHTGTYELVWGTALVLVTGAAWAMVPVRTAR